MLLAVFGIMFSKKGSFMFRFLLLPFIFLFAFVGVSFAFSPSPSATPNATPAVSVDYVLPYPGILPDNALYKIKMVRDRIGSLLIRDDLRQAEYLLKMGDKRISASKYLSDYGNCSLASQTASKAEIYLLRSVEEAGKAKNIGVNVSAFLGTLSKATLKHVELLEQMMVKAPDGPKQSLEKSIILANDVYKRTQDLLK